MTERPLQGDYHFGIGLIGEYFIREDAIQVGFYEHDEFVGVATIREFEDFEDAMRQAYQEYDTARIKRKS